MISYSVAEIFFLLFIFTNPVIVLVGHEDRFLAAGFGTGDHLGLGQVRRAVLLETGNCGISVQRRSVVTGSIWKARFRATSKDDKTVAG